MNSAINWILYGNISYSLPSNQSIISSGALNSQLQQRASNHSEPTSARMTKVTATPVDRFSTVREGMDKGNNQLINSVPEWIQEYSNGNKDCIDNINTRRRRINGC